MKKRIKRQKKANIGYVVSLREVYFQNIIKTRDERIKRCDNEWDCFRMKKLAYN